MDWFSETQEAFARSNHEGIERCYELSKQNDPHALSLAAWAVACFGTDVQLVAARDWAERAADLAPGDSEVLHTLVWVYASQEDWDAVVPILARWLEGGPMDEGSEAFFDDLAHLVQKAHTDHRLADLVQTSGLLRKQDVRYLRFQDFLRHLLSPQIPSLPEATASIKRWKTQYQELYS